MISPEQFLVEKGILISTDLETRWNLNITRDCYVGTSRRIVEAMKEYLALYVASERDHRKAEVLMENNDSGPMSGLPCDFDINNPDKVIAL